MSARSLFKKDVEIIATAMVIEALTGKSIYQVIFGEVTEVTDEMRPHFPQPVGTVPPKKINANVLVLFFDSEEPSPYRVGSKWTVEMGSDGAITAKPKVAR